MKQEAILCGKNRHISVKKANMTSSFLQTFLNQTHSSITCQQNLRGIHRFKKAFQSVHKDCVPTN